MAEASSSSSIINNHSDSYVVVSSPAPAVQENHQTQQQNILYRVTISLSDAAGFTDRDDALSCLVILLTFWFFVSMTLILGVYGSNEIMVGPNTSRLILANSIFVQDIKAGIYLDGNKHTQSFSKFVEGDLVKEEEVTQNKLFVYGFHELPPLNVPVFWSERHNMSISANFHKDWVYYLNKGSVVNISYAVNYEGSYPLHLIVAKGRQELLRWVENPSAPSNTLSWNIIVGNGTISQKIEESSEYFIAVGNLNNFQADVQLEFKINSILYNTTGAYYICPFKHRQCSLKLLMLKPVFAILSTGLIKEYDAIYVTLSFGPRWFVYFIGSACMTVLLLLIYKILNKLLHNHQMRYEVPVNNEQRTPLLTNKDDDNSSLGSSYESVSHDEEDIEEWLKMEAAKSLESGSSNLCSICCDAPRDCFFLPCGHSATCYPCAERISDEAGTCPICRRRMKKVRRIFTV
ncbi:RING/U-box superfamily protein [Rhynchospora pubera]|uniref:RING/U-box superfamily protein n=1 Tax=Rhynchospora pubera TaxID=906938 RepID=A0AAV8HXK8_9POAL|nr:RING/U-box superfamily protein [Rhynchospora pubera]